MMKQLHENNDIYTPYLFP